MPIKDLSPRKYDKLLNKAREFAYSCGRYMISRLGKANFCAKSDKDLVTEVDVYVENYLIKNLSRVEPSFGFLAEEENQKRPSGLYYWVIDPIDGTNNYAHTYPFFCTSIALVEGKRPIMGVIYDPVRDEMFWAGRDEGAFLNKRQIYPSKITRLGDALLCTGFAYRFRELKDNNLDNFGKFLYKTQGVRRDGSAALDLCYVACGRLDGFWEMHLKPWDTAAGAYILRQAGGRITKFSGGRFDIYFPEILASNGKIHKQMLDVLRGRK